MVRVPTLVHLCPIKEQLQHSIWRAWKYILSSLSDRVRSFFLPGLNSRTVDVSRTKSVPIAEWPACSCKKYPVCLRSQEVCLHGQFISH